MYYHSSMIVTFGYGSVRNGNTRHHDTNRRRKLTVAGGSDVANLWQQNTEETFKSDLNGYNSATSGTKLIYPKY